MISENIRNYSKISFEDSEICSIGMIHPSNSRHSGLSLLSGMSTFS
ncbi:putative ubiquitin-protein ligase, partial [Danaus plexippus plexippus]